MKRKYSKPLETLKSVDYCNRNYGNNNNCRSLVINNAIRRLKELSNKHNSHVHKKDDKYIWNAPDVLYGIRFTNDGYNILILRKDDCLDSVFQAYTYTSEDNRKYVVLYDDVVYDKEQEIDMFLYTHVLCLFTNKKLADIFMDEYKQYENGFRYNYVIKK